jgi:aminomethyltransferase
VPESRYSPLHQLHIAAGASFTDFAGWQMPVSYGSDLAEHHAVRTAAGLFDISHMAEIRVDGRDSAAFLDFALAGRLSAIAPCQAKYSLLLNEHGGIIDDLVVYRGGEKPDAFLIVANAGNRVEVLTALQERAAGFRVAVSDESDLVALIAVQGPVSRQIVESVLDVDLSDLGYYWGRELEWGGRPFFLARTGYTGEDGFELYVTVRAAADLWQRLLEAGEPLGLIAAGLASRDTLRLEAGMPLYGHELGTDTFPQQAGLGRVVALAGKGDFVGRAAVEAGPPAGSRLLVGLAMDGRRAGRAGYTVHVLEPDGVAPENEPVGVVTSGALSPTLGHPIAMAYVDADVVEAGTPLAIDVRGTRIPASRVTLPFYKRESK